MRNLYLPSTTLAAFIVISACGGNDETTDPFEAALPDTQVLTLELPAPASLSQDLTEGEVGSTTAALVGEPADFYTSTYYQARTINLFGRGVLETLDAITDFPPSARTATIAVWGPFRADREPNEFQLVVEARESPTPHFVWYLAGRPVSGGDFVGLAGGAYEPTGDNEADDGEEYGRGWFAIDFDQVAGLNPAEEARGVVAYAFGKSEEGVAVRVVAQNANQTPDTVAYAYGENTEGFGYILFAFEDDIHDGEDGQDADEGLVVRTRWLPDGRGRADVLAVHGDLGDGFVQVSQCWDDTFVSRYEALVANGLTLGQDGDVSACVFDGEWPSEEELPEGEDLASPFASDTPVGG